jgi:hypothetical protein
MTSEPPPERLRHMRDVRAELRKRNDPQARLIKAKLAEVRDRYAKRRRERDPPPLAALRMRDLETIFERRYGRHLPADDVGHDCAWIAANHLANLPRGDQTTNVIKWLARWAPWMTQHEMDALAIQAIEHNIRWKADKLGKRLRLTDGDRSAWCIRTIGAIGIVRDPTKDERLRLDAAKAAAPYMHPKLQTIDTRMTLTMDDPNKSSAEHRAELAQMLGELGFPEEVLSAVLCERVDRGRAS